MAKAFTIPSPKSVRRIRNQQGLTLEKGLEKQIAAGYDLPATPNALSPKRRSILAKQLDVDRKLENLNRTMMTDKDIPYKDGKFYQGAINKGVEWAEKHKDVKHGNKTSIHGSYLPKKLKDYDNRLEQLWKSKNFSLEAKEKFTLLAAKQGERQMRTEIADERSGYIKHLTAQREDLQGKLTGDNASDLMYSFFQGIEMVKAPGRLLAQGEDVGMAYQEAARTAAYHEPDSTMDKYIHMAAANAAPMGTALAANMVPVVGTAMSGAIIASYTGTDSYYDLRRAGVSKSTAKSGALAVGLSTAATEMWLGKALSKVPGVNKIVSEGGRGARIKILTGALRGSKKLPSLLARNTKGKLAAGQLAEALKAVFTDTSRLALLGNVTQAAAGEALTGGVEEWLQQGMQLAFTEAAAKYDGLDSLLPHNEDGTYDVGAILGEMNDAFVAGAILEGAYGAAGISANFTGRWQKAKAMEQTRSHIKSEAERILYDPKTRTVETEKTVANKAIDIMEGIDSGNIPASEALQQEVSDYLEQNLRWGMGLENLSPESVDYLSRYVLTASQNYKGETWNPKAFNKELNNSLNSLFKDPVQGYLIQHGGDAAVKEFVPGKAFTIKVGNLEVVAVKSDEVLTDAQGNEVPLQYTFEGENEKNLKISPKLWKKIEGKGLGENVVKFNHFTGSGFVHELTHAIISNSPAAEGSAIIQAYNETGPKKEGLTDEQTQVESLERPAIAAEKRPIQIGQSPIKTKAGDVYAALDVMFRGDQASPASKRIHFEAQVARGLKTGKAVDTSYLSGRKDMIGEGRAVITGIGRKAGPVVDNVRQRATDAKPTIQAIGRKAGQVAQVGKQKITGFGKKGEAQSQSMPRVTEIGTTKQWARYAPQGQQGYEVSTQGDRRFSALNAKLSDGRTIEEHYQVDVKGYDSIREGKGKPPINDISKEQSYDMYKDLWRQFANKNMDLMRDLYAKSKGKVLTDKFANTDVSQARALAEILDELTNPRADDPRDLGITPAPYGSITAEQAYADKVGGIMAQAEHDARGFSQTTGKKVITQIGTPKPRHTNKFDKTQKDATRRYGTKKLLGLHKATESGEIGQTPFEDVQDHYDAYMSMAAQNRVPLMHMTEYKNTEFVSGLRDTLNADDGNADAAADIIKNANAETLAEFGTAEADTIMEAVDVSSQESSAIERAPSDSTIRLTAVKRNIADTKSLNPLSQEIAIQPKTKGILGKKKRVYHTGVYLPVTEALYIDLFGVQRDDGRFTERSSYNPEGYVDILRVGDMEFNLDRYYGKQLVDNMSEALGPMWAIIAEEQSGNNQADGKDTKLYGDIEKVYNDLKSDLLNRPGDKDAIQKPLRAALHALYTYSTDKVTLTGAKSGATYDINSQIEADSILDFFKEKGFKDDGTDLLYSLLQSQDPKRDVEDMYAQDKMQQEVWGVDQALQADAMSVIDMEPTAQKIGAEFLRDLSELLNANMNEQDVTQLVGKMMINFKDKETGEQKQFDAAGVAASPRAVAKRAINNRTPMNRTGLVNEVASISRLDAESTIGELLKSKVDKYKLIEETHNDAEKGQAYKNSVGATPAGVKNLLDKLITSTEPLAVSEEKAPLNRKRTVLKDALDLMNDLYSDLNVSEADVVEKMDEYLKLDPDAGALSSLIYSMESDIANHKDALNMSMERVTGESADKIVAAAMTHIDFADQMFSLAGMRKMKAQIENLKLQKEYMNIFGVQSEMKMRDIIRHVVGSFFGSKNKAGTGDFQARGIAADYSLASHFAADALNSKDKQVTLDGQRSSIQSTIDRLKAIDKLTTQQNADLAQFERYMAVMDKAQEIADGTGEYGGKVKTWLDGQYKTMSSNFYDDVIAQSRFAGPKVDVYSARAFTETSIEQEMPEHVMTQISKQMLPRKEDNLVNALKQGRTFKFNDFLINYLESQNQAVNALANQEMIEANLFDNFFKLAPADGYSMLKPAGAKLYTLKITVDGKVTHRGIRDGKKALEIARGYNDAKIGTEYRDIYAPNEIAAFFNKITATSPLRQNKYLLGLMSLNAKLKAIRINFGMFHRRGLLWSAMIAGKLNPELAFNADDLTDPSGAWKKIKGRFDYGSKRQQGMDLMTEFSPEFFALNHYGMTSFQISDIGKENQQHKNIVDKYLAGSRRSGTVKILGKSAKQFDDLTSRLQGELFGIFGSSLKTATAFDELQALLTKNQEQITKEKQASEKTNTLTKHFKSYNEVFGEVSIEFNDYYSATEEKAYRTVAGMANADFGGLHYGRMGISRGGQDIMRLLLLGPDWTYSNILSAIKALPSFKERSGNISGVGTNFSGTDMEAEVYRHFWLRIIGRSMALMLAFNLIMAGIDDETAAERLAKAKKRGKFNWLKADISPLIHMFGGDKETDHYLNTLGHFLDPPKIALDPARMAYHKSSAIAKPVMDIMSGTRYDMKRPTKITKIGQQGLYTWQSGKRGPVAPSEMPSFMIWQAMQTLPIQAKNVFEIFSGERNVITGVGTAGLGLDISRTYER